jgi:hypothetical protein
VVFARERTKPARSGLDAAVLVFLAVAVASFFPLAYEPPSWRPPVLLRLIPSTGPLAGAAIFTWLRDEVARRTEFWRAVMGGVILAIVLLFPQGLVGGLKALNQHWREARSREKTA